MVIVAKSTSSSLSSSHASRLLVCLTASVGLILVIYFVDSTHHELVPSRLKQERRGEDTSHSISAAAPIPYTCPYMKLSDMTEAERYPKATAERHIVDPPADTRLTLVCCHTSEGPWSIAAHHAWAPLGAARFLEMVHDGHFSSPKVPLMRCIRNFLCQFGLNGAARARRYGSLPDDPQWLPAGPGYRRNEWDVKRFARGYLSYAGAGPRSRSDQLFVALHDDPFLGGGSPWEVPWGELVGRHSYETLDKIYTGYGEKGPSQGMLQREGAIERTEREFPEISWILGCWVVDEI